MRRKSAIIPIFLVVSVLFGIYASHALLLWLRKQPITWGGVLLSWNLERLKFSGIFTILLSGIFLLIYFSDSLTHQSREDVITDRIRTPKAVGQGQHGSARWMSEKEKDTAFFERKSGLVVGQRKGGGFYYAPGDTHTLTIGSTGAAKTRRVIIPSLYEMARSGENMIISDPKGELYYYLGGYLRREGYRVVCFDFRRPFKSDRYNFLFPIIEAMRAGDYALSEIRAWDLANAIAGESKSREKIWDDGEKAVIAASILSVCFDATKRPELQNLSTAYWFVAELGGDAGEAKRRGYLARLPSHHPARAMLAIPRVAPGKTQGSFDTSVLTTLRLFATSPIYHMTSSHDLEGVDLSREKTAIFLVLPDEKSTYYPLCTLMISQLYEHLIERSDERGGELIRRMNFVLDETGNLSKITDISAKITAARSRNIRFHLFLQSFDQLKEKYSESAAKIIKGNCDVWIYLKSTDPETHQEIAKKLGRYTTSAYSLSSGSRAPWHRSYNLSLVGRDLLTPDEVSQIEPPHRIVLSPKGNAVLSMPELSELTINRELGMGNYEENRKLRERIEREREASAPPSIEFSKLWEQFEQTLSESGRKLLLFRGAYSSEKENL